MRDVSDGEPWQRSRRGEKEAFGILFERYARDVYNFCFRQTGDWELAEDLVSLVFLEAWRRRDVELASDKVRPWLLGVATNLTRNRRRSLLRYRAALRRLQIADSTPDFADDADRRLDDQRQMQAILEVVNELPKRDREVLVLCIWADLSYEDAAFALGIPVGTVRSRLSRARARLGAETESPRPEPQWAKKKEG